MIGTSLGPYKIIEPLGAGGMGEVYLGEDTRLGRKVAKRLVKSRWSQADSGRKRKYYALTAKGTAWLCAHREQWHRLVSAMKGLGVVSPEADS